MCIMIALMLNTALKMKLSNEFLELLSALKCVLHGQQPQGDVYFEKLFEVARKQAVDGMLFDLSGLEVL